MHKNVRLISGALTIVFLLLTYTQCVLEYKPAPNKKPTSTTSTQETQSNSVPNNLPTPIVVEDIPDPGGDDTVMTNPIALERVDLGVKNFEQINETMSTLTGVDPNLTAIKNAYSSVTVQLPTENDIKSFLAANQVAITKLAAEYCDRLIESSTLRAVVYPGFNFGTTGTAAFTQANRDYIVIRSMDHFWGPTMDAPARAASQAELQSLLTDLINGENLSSTTNVRKIVKGVCTAVLASANTILL
ncbi:MAG: hypothetical protein Fur0010_08770 [Bdellovibrio sp.]